MKSIFCNERVLMGIDSYNKTITLREENTNDQITIKNIPDDSILIKLDVPQREYRQKSFYLRRGIPFVHKGCDYCLICPKLERVFLFELKSTKPKGFVNQFIASKIFIEYCNALWAYQSNSKKIYQYINVLISKIDNNLDTKGKNIKKVKLKDDCQNDFSYISTGFPYGINLSKLYN